VDIVAVEPDKARGSRPAAGPSSRNGLFDDDEDDLFAPAAAAASKPAAANKKGLWYFAIIISIKIVHEVHTKGSKHDTNKKTKIHSLRAIRTDSRDTHINIIPI